jgi:hypothetical protein
VLDALTLDAFAPHVGEEFVLVHEQAGRLELELLEARAVGGDRAPGNDRRPFSLLFRGPVEPLLPQRIYRLEHDTVGPLEIFIVPVARDAAGTHYEAIFA